LVEADLASTEVRPPVLIGRRHVEQYETFRVRERSKAIVRVRLLVLKVSKPNQNIIGGHNITKLLDNVFQCASVFIVG
jgi:hypothetical protein